MLKTIWKESITGLTVSADFPESSFNNFIIDMGTNLTNLTLHLKKNVIGMSFFLKYCPCVEALKVYRLTSDKSESLFWGEEKKAI